MDYLDKIQKFYDVKFNLEYSVIFVWWPPISSTKANPVSRYLLMKYNPVKHDEGTATDIVMHEIIHVISKYQSLSKKRTLTDLFLKTCSLSHEKIKRYEILEEPLAVILGQMYFTELFHPKNFDVSSKWYNNDKIDFFSKSYYPIVKDHFSKGHRIDSEMILKLSTLCKTLKVNAEK